MTKRALKVIRLGLTRYQTALRIQEDAFEKVACEEQPDTLFLTEHPHIYTLGSQTERRHLLFTPDELESKNIEVIEVKRGGDVTYHGYGQLVGYPILNLHHFYLDAHRYLRDLEEVVIETLHRLGVYSHRKTHPNPKKNYTGVWVGDEKICAVGARFSRWTTMHGLALNVNTDLSFFDGIVPCGISEMGVTSLAKILGSPIEMETVCDKFIQSFQNVFNVEILIDDQHGRTEPPY
jgi:lipoyl(octanoyl) transferase